ncbi:protein RarD [Nocardioides psychrotolerans]|uniref:Chloramphenicol-sensitive protein RarD n=1 Tax=Nocardioides psychrotolerans TaxID=1005945 RepID=A0A1I3I218_9ACTN|nr:EamA family transporter RarD [Nocardioides psychrotolerans]GEP38638.1 protein RarD [Nocardioides psychrotolerans]SFI41889.1 chloramphenicol-sensitive protein RarD [Nocardioides psychrotolerans]
MPESRKGLLLGASAYLLWGLFPLYWPLLEPAGAAEILAHRVLWSSITMGLLVLVLRRTTHLRAFLTNRRLLGLLALSAVTVTSNWALYIWGVNNGRVVETSLGYFINPLVTVLMGVVLLGERLRRPQWAAMGVGLIAVVVLTLDYGRLPWLALALAFSFGTYGLAKKTADVGAVEGLAFETMLVTPFALAYVGWLVATGASSFGTEGAGHAALLVTTGLVTAVPLICFGAAATRIPMVTIGLLQYLAPVLQFGFGVFYFGEDMPTGRWIGFALVWVALAMFTWDALRHRRRQLVLSVAGATAA